MRDRPGLGERAVTGADDERGRAISDIRWPARFRPGTAPIHVRNTLAVAAPPAAVWVRLVRATGWPDYYANASKVRIDGGGDDLAAGTTFRWRTFGVDLVTRVEEFVPANGSRGSPTA